MKKWNRALLVILIICLFGSILTFKDFLTGFYSIMATFVFNFSFLSYLWVLFFVFNINFGHYFLCQTFYACNLLEILYFFVTLPITLIFYGFYIFFCLIVPSQNNQNLNLVVVAWNLNENAITFIGGFCACNRLPLLLCFFSFCF